MAELLKNLIYPVYLNYFIQLMSDFWFVCPNFELAESYANQQLDVYVYELKHRPYDSIFPSFLGTTIHVDDLAYTFALYSSNKVSIYKRL
jgi:carboxylesterase type B